MGYSIISKNPPGIICMSDVEFDCPSCGQHYDELFYMKRLEKSELGFIYKRCRKCGEKIGISSDIAGDTVVWLKKNESLSPNS